MPKVITLLSTRPEIIRQHAGWTPTEFAAYG